MLALRIKKAVRNGATLVVADPRADLADEDREAPPAAAPGHGRLAPERDHAHDPRGGPAGRGVHRASTPRTSTRCARSSPRYTPEEAERVTGVPADAIRATAREYATRAARGDLLHARHHRARLRRRQHLVAREPRPDDRPPRLRVDRPERAARPEQRPGPERLRRQPALPPRLPARRTTPTCARSSRRPGASTLPETPGYRLDQMMSRPARRPDQGALPDRREPGADRAERAPRRGGPRRGSSSSSRRTCS